VRTLIRWGKFQLEQQDKCDENLRSKILPGLRRIRFDNLSQQEVAQLFKEELGEVLTGDEKYSILMSIITDDWKMMPTDIVPPSKLTPRHEPYTFISLPYDLSHHNRSNARDATIRFTINKKAIIVGVKLNTSALGHHSLSSISLKILKKEWTLIGTGGPKSTSLHKGQMFYKFSSSPSLVADTEYCLEFTFAESLACSRLGEVNLYTLPRDKNPSHSDGLTLTMHELYLKCFAHILGIVFKKP
jgi:hypothetical protein